MPFPSFLVRLGCALLLACAAHGAQAQLTRERSVVTTERVRAELLVHAPEGVAPGKPVWLGLRVTHQPQWHTYWKNPGDTGLPTTLQWTLPRGLEAGEIAWPVPRRIAVGPLVNFGYEGTVLLPVPITVANTFQPSPLASTVEVRLKASWLVCKTECIPEDGQFTLALPVNSSTALNAADFEAALAAQPRAVPQMPAGGGPASSATIGNDALDLRVQALPAELRGQRLELFPELAEVVESSARWTQQWDGAVWTARVPLSAMRSSSPGVLPVVLAQEDGKAWRAQLRVAGTWPPVAASTTVPPALQDALRASSAGLAATAPRPIGLLAALAGALLGGLILNLMPCVFPVLAIKVVGFAQRADDVRGHRIAALSYTAGVVLSFVLLGALMLTLRAAGEQLGWGFQLQSPWTVAALAALFTLVGLNLAGVFEFGALLPSSVAGAHAKHPVLDAFVSGVLAVAVASPCTAPFMGASLGLAIVLPAPRALLVFAMLGVGMALPYLAAGLAPPLARLLPRPGVWMDVFRRLMAFPMFATVAWLVWVLGQQSGIDGAGALLVLLVLVSLLAWALALRGGARRILAPLALVGLLVGGWMLVPRLAIHAPVQAARDSGDWQPWSDERARQIVAAGRPVFIDFTAAWCITCRVNEKTTLENAALLDDLRRANVALLRADWTRRDPAITQALAQLGRSGVPVYVVLQPGRPARVLSELISAHEVRSAVLQ